MFSFFKKNNNNNHNSKTEESTTTITMSSTSSIKQLTPDILLHITQYLDVKSILALSLSCKSFSSLIGDERVLKRKVKSDYKISYKKPSLTWQQLYQQLQRHQISLCPHLGEIPDELPTSKHQLSADYRQKIPLCDICHTNKAMFLSLNPTSDIQVCRPCSNKEEGPSSVQFNLHTQSLYCFKCSRPVGGESTNENENYKGKVILDQLRVEPTGHDEIKVTSTTSGIADTATAATDTMSTLTSPDTTPSSSPSSEASITTDMKQQQQQQEEEKDKELKEVEDLDQRRKREQLLYVQELRQVDMTLKHYLVEKSWGRAWMLFRTREGSPPPGPITNNKLARANGTLDPSIRVPMDKYRPAPETHADIVSENLWKYLEKTYGVLGRAYSEDDIQGPEYARLRICMDDFKHSIELYP